MAAGIGQYRQIVSQHLQNASQKLQMIVGQNVQKTTQDLISWASEAFVIMTQNKEETPSFEQKKQDCQKDLLRFQTVSAAALVANITFTTVGFGFCLARWPFTGSGFLLLNVPLSYCTYNLYRSLDNARDVIQNPKNYVIIHQGSTDRQVDNDKVKAQITKGTFCFEWFYHLVISYLKSKPATL